MTVDLWNKYKVDDLYKVRLKVTIEGFIGKIRLGDLHPVRVMGVINLSRESFYEESYAGIDAVLGWPAFAEEG